MISPPIDAPSDSDIMPTARRKTPARNRIMKITIIANDELTGSEMTIVVNDGTSTGLPTAAKCQEMLNQLNRKQMALLCYVSHSVVTA